METRQVGTIPRAGSTAKGPCRGHRRPRPREAEKRESPPATPLRLRGWSVLANEFLGFELRPQISRDLLSKVA